MGSANVNWPTPLTRLNPVYPGQMGVHGAWTETGLRLHHSGAIFWVDPNCTYAEDAQDGTDPTHPLETVERAIRLCQPYRGDVIAVMANNAWIYHNAADGYLTPINEQVTIDVPGVRLVGVCPSGSLGVPWLVPEGTGIAITITAMDVVIEGFAFVGVFEGTSNSAIVSAWNGSTVYGENLTVRHCFFDWEIDLGIGLSFNYFTQIHDNWFCEQDEYAIWADPAGDPCNALRIYNNLFWTPGTTACCLTRTTYSQIFNNWFYDAQLATPAAKANCFINLTGGSNNLVHQNVLGCPLPGPVNDYDNACTGGTRDMWVQNFCSNGPTTTNPT